MRIPPLLPVLIFTCALFLFVLLNVVLSTGTDPDNLRRWIGSLSGWAAAAAAAATFFILQSQLRELKAQSDFITGNLPVELAWEQEQESASFGDPNWIFLYAINFGIRPVRLTGMRFSSCSKDLSFWVASIDERGQNNTHFAVDNSGLPGGRIYEFFVSVPGWTDRTAQAPKHTFSVSIDRTDQLGTEIDLVGDETFAVEIEYTILGKHKKKEKSITNVITNEFIHLQNNHNS